MTTRIQTRAEEKANGFTHGLGIVFCLVASPFILTAPFQAQNWGLLLGLGAFCIGMLMVYTFSTLYHLAIDPKIKQRLKTLDHISIYMLIAGTYTPFVRQYLPTETANIFLAVLWSLVLIGTLYKLLFIGKWKWFSLVLYLGMGWMVVFVAQPLSETLPLEVFWWILAGGLSYTIGVYFFVNSNRPYFHAIWHLFVLLGTVLHFVAIYIGQANSSFPA